MIRHRLLPATLAALVLGAGPAPAADPTLRGDVVATHDTLTVGDLIEHAPPALAEAPLFRSPGLGGSGTIQTRRILAAAEALGIKVETRGRLQVTVTRAARRIGVGEMEAALRKRLAAEFGLDPASTGIALDDSAVALIASPDLKGEPVASEVTLDRRSRRISAAIWLGPSPTERRAQIRVHGAVVDLVEVAVASRALERGQSVKASDITIERRARDLVPQDAAHDGAPVEGRVTRRPVSAGTVLRPADLARPELVAKGDMVTAVYEAPGVALSLRVRAQDAGALGDTVTVVNPQSKKPLQAVVVGAGRVSVNAGATGRLAAAAPRISP